MDNSFVKTPEEVCNFFSVDSSKGLKDVQVKEQQRKFGKNGKIHPVIVTFFFYYYEN
jgi:hypothetical protein